MQRLITACVLALSSTFAAAQDASQPSESQTSPEPAKTNVLLVCMDDLRPDYASFGQAAVKTPNIDRLAASGLRFERAYAQYPICMPSRVSVFTGYRPRTLNFTSRASGHVPPGTVTLPQLFRNNGYTTVSIGKNYHQNDDNPAAWVRRYTDTFYEGKWCPGYCSDYRLQSNLDTLEGYLKGWRFSQNPRPASSMIEIIDKADESTPDGRIARHAVEEMRKFKENGEPFFLAVGFYRPHMPLTAPKKYWDMYDREQVEVPENFNIPPAGPRLDWNEVRRYGDMPPEGPMPEDMAKEVIRGYRASVTFADAQLGLLLDELDRLGLDQNTVVLLWSDNGWRLGEHGMWSKPDATEIPSTITLIVRAPGVPAAKPTRALVELVDIYPTVAELCGLQGPEYLEGDSVVPLLHDPDRPWKKAAFTSVHTRQESVRTDRYRLIKTGNKLELYDYQTDSGENHNLADAPDHAETVQELLALLRAGWKAVRPE